MEKTQQEVRQFLGRFFRHQGLGNDDDIFAGGFMNSLILVQLISFIESQFLVKIEDGDLEFENFRTITRIVALIEKKQSANENEATVPVGENHAG
ncbi:MAG TPA: acyl carrier protein [Candidatus Angelobacter sp.]|jgi:acyl carrier protein